MLFHSFSSQDERRKFGNGDFLQFVFCWLVQICFPTGLSVFIISHRRDSTAVLPQNLPTKSLKKKRPNQFLFGRFVDLIVGLFLFGRMHKGLGLGKVLGRHRLMQLLKGNFTGIFVRSHRNDAVGTLVLLHQKAGVQHGAHRIVGGEIQHRQHQQRGERPQQEGKLKDQNFIADAAGGVYRGADGLPNGGLPIQQVVFGKKYR